MNYEPNTIHWKLGDLVIHDYDLKRPSMLMRVIGFTKEGEVVTRYENPQPPFVSLRGRKKAWVNDRKYLHDPALFKIMKTPKEKLMQTTISLTPQDLASLLLPFVRKHLGRPELTADDLQLLDGVSGSDYLLKKLSISVDLQVEDDQKKLDWQSQCEGRAIRPKTEVEQKLVVGGIYRCKTRGSLGFECLEVSGEQSNSNNIVCWLVNEKGDRFPEINHAILVDRSEFGERINQGTPTELRQTEDDRTLYVNGIYWSRYPFESDEEYNCYQIIEVASEECNCLCWVVDEYGRKTPDQRKYFKKPDDLGEFVRWGFPLSNPSQRKNTEGEPN